MLGDWERYVVLARGVEEVVVKDAETGLAEMVIDGRKGRLARLAQREEVEYWGRMVDSGSDWAWVAGGRGVMVGRGGSTVLLVDWEKVGWVLVAKEGEM